MLGPDARGAGLGSIVVALLSGWTRHVHHHGRAVALAACGWGVAIVGFGFADVLWLALVFLAFAGGMDAVSGLFRSVIWNETIPDRLRGRLAGVEMISYTSGPTLGNFEAGVVASLAGVRASIVSGGVMCVVGTGVVLAFLPALWRYDAREGVADTARQALPLAHETWFEAGHRDLDWSFAGETATLLLLAGAVALTLVVRVLAHVWPGIECRSSRGSRRGCRSRSACTSRCR